MDFAELARELIEPMYLVHRDKLVRHINQMSQGEEYVLLLLKDSKDSLFPRDISKIMGITSARVAAILRRLEEKGLVTRKGSTTDHRCTKVIITEKGDSVIAAQQDKAVAYLTKVLTQLGQEDAVKYTEIMKKIYHNNNDIDRKEANK